MTTKTTKTSAQLYGPGIRGENLATNEMFEEAGNCLKSLLEGEDMQPANLMWVAGKTADDIKAELGEPKEISGLQPTREPKVFKYWYKKEKTYVYEQDGITFIYHNIFS